MLSPAPHYMSLLRLAKDLPNDVEELKPILLEPFRYTIAGRIKSLHGESDPTKLFAAIKAVRIKMAVKKAEAKAAERSGTSAPPVAVNMDEVAAKGESCSWLRLLESERAQPMQYACVGDVLNDDSISRHQFIIRRNALAAKSQSNWSVAGFSDDDDAADESRMSDVASAASPLAGVPPDVFEAACATLPKCRGCKCCFWPLEVTDAVPDRRAFVLPCTHTLCATCANGSFKCLLCHADTPVGYPTLGLSATEDLLQQVLAFARAASRPAADKFSYHICDIGSTNDMFVNKTKIKKKMWTRLNEGAVVQFIKRTDEVELCVGQLMRAQAHNDQTRALKLKHDSERTRAVRRLQLEAICASGVAAADAVVFLDFCDPRRSGVCQRHADFSAAWADLADSRVLAAQQATPLVFAHAALVPDIVVADAVIRKRDLHVEYVFSVNPSGPSPGREHKRVRDADADEEPHAKRAHGESALGRFCTANRLRACTALMAGDSVVPSAALVDQFCADVWMNTPESEHADGDVLIPQAKLDAKEQSVRFERFCSANKAAVEAALLPGTVMNGVTNELQAFLSSAWKTIPNKQGSGGIVLSASMIDKWVVSVWFLRFESLNRAATTAALHTIQGCRPTDSEQRTFCRSIWNDASRAEQRHGNMKIRDRLNELVRAAQASNASKRAALDRRVGAAELELAEANAKARRLEAVTHAAPASSGPAEPQQDVLEDNTTCTICQQLFHHTIVLPCTHAFCQHCILEWHVASPERSCPICRAPIGDREMVRLRNVDNIVVSVVRTTFSDDQRRERAAHIAACDVKAAQAQLTIAKRIALLASHSAPPVLDDFDAHVDQARDAQLKKQADKDKAQRRERDSYNQRRLEQRQRDHVTLEEYKENFPAPPLQPLQPLQQMAVTVSTHRDRLCRKCYSMIEPQSICLTDAALQHFHLECAHSSTCLAMIQGLSLLPESVQAQVRLKF